jgi:hypothetical protein
METKSKKSSNHIGVISVVITLCIVIVSLTTIFNSQRSSMLPDCVVSTKDEAIKNALPLAQTYAQENNRTITTIGSKVVYVNDRPYWGVTINFKDLEKNENGAPSQQWIYGYYVSIWADTGEIQHHSILGNYVL